MTELYSNREDSITAINAASDALTDAAQFIDAVRQDAISEGWWTDWDQQMRDKITKALRDIQSCKLSSQDQS